MKFIAVRSEECASNHKSRNRKVQLHLCRWCGDVDLIVEDRGKKVGRDANPLKSIPIGPLRKMATIQIPNGDPSPASRAKLGVRHVFSH
jgi:hypothetical protein